MTEIILTIHLLIALGLIAVVLLQRSEGGALGIGGGGGGGGMFTSRGAGNVLTKATAILAAGFFVTSITLTMLATRSNAPTSSVLETVKSKPGTKKPAPSGPVLPRLPGAPPAGQSTPPAGQSTPPAGQ